MPTVKANELKAGMVLVDPSGVLYEIIGVHDALGVKTFVWLWPDVSKQPDMFQSFEPDEEVNFISQNPVVDIGPVYGPENNPADETQVIPAVTEDVTDANGTAE